MEIVGIMSYDYDGENPTTPNTLQWRHDGRDSVSNHQPHDCLLSRSFKRRSKKTSKIRVTGICAVNSPGTGEFPAQMASLTRKMLPFDDVIMKLSHRDQSLFYGFLSSCP